MRRLPLVSWPLGLRLVHQVAPLRGRKSNKSRFIGVSGNCPGGPGASAMRRPPVPVNRSGTSSTRSPASAKLIEARGATPLYLPLYSHLNPIELLETQVAAAQSGGSFN
jgi:hypothetical protein